MAQASLEAVTRQSTQSTNALEVKGQDYLSSQDKELGDKDEKLEELSVEIQQMKEQSSKLQRLIDASAKTKQIQEETISDLQSELEQAKNRSTEVTEQLKAIAEDRDQLRRASAAAPDVEVILREAEEARHQHQVKSSGLQQTIERLEAEVQQRNQEVQTLSNEVPRL